MQAPLVGNNLIFRRWCDKENEYMSRKLNGIKSELRVKCPQSFTFSKNKNKTNINTFSKLFTKLKNI